MDKLINIVGILRSYVNRCAKCDTGRKKNCPWIAAFATSAATAIQEGATHEDRALAAHENAGSPCESQITFDDFIDQVDSFAHDAEMPAKILDRLLL